MTSWTKALLHRRESTDEGSRSSASAADVVTGIDEWLQDEMKFGASATARTCQRRASSVCAIRQSGNVDDPAHHGSSYAGARGIATGLGRRPIVISLPFTCPSKVTKLYSTGACVYAYRTLFGSYLGAVTSNVSSSPLLATQIFPGLVHHQDCAGEDRQHNEVDQCQALRLEDGL